MRRGTLNGASCCATKSWSSRSSAAASELSTTAAAISSPSRSSASANVTAWSTAAWRSRASSISIGETFSPPRLMISLMRPRSVR